MNKTGTALTPSSGYDSVWCCSFTLTAEVTLNPNLQDRLKEVVYIQFHEPGGTISLSDRSGRNLPIGLLETDNKLIVGHDQEMRHSIVHLIEIFTGYTFKLTRVDDHLITYMRWS